MKNITYPILGIYFVFMASTIYAQSYLSITVQDILCPQSTSGSLTLNFVADITDQYPFPYICELENLTNGDYYEVTITDYDTTIPGLAAGEYRIDILLPSEDADCDIVETVTLEEYNDMTLLVEPMDATYFGNCTDGAITLDISGGVPPYRVIWFDVSNPTNPLLEVEDVFFSGSEDDLTNIGPGEYVVIVEDDFCGSTFQEVNIACACGDYGFSFAENFLLEPIIRIGFNHPNIQYPVTIQYFNESGTQVCGVETIDSPTTTLIGSCGLVEGESYCVVLTDGDGCEQQTCFTVPTSECPSPFLITLNEITPDCNKLDNGAISVRVEGGCDNYIPLWLNETGGVAGTTSTPKNLTAIRNTA